MMRALLRLASYASCLALAACGGGGSDSGGAIQPPQTVSVSVQPSQNTIGVNSLTDVIVTVSRRGTGVADGTTVSLSVDQPTLGQVGAASGENQSFNNSATATTSAGQARFRFKSTTVTGTATVRASVNDPNTPAQNITASANIALNGGPSNDTRLRLHATRTTIPVNVNNIAPFIGSPYEATVDIELRDLLGDLVNPPDEDYQFSANWASLDGVGGISIPDDPETTDVNEYLNLYTGVPVGMNAGHGTVFVRSLDQAGTGTLTVGIVDLDTGENLSASLEFTISSGVPNVPGNVTVVPQGPPAYVNGSRQLQILVNDGAGTPVPNPQGFNNVQLEIIDPQGERLRVMDVAGVTQTGPLVRTNTANGIAGALFLSGERQGTITVRATADGADNNVDNGITDPVVGENTIVVSDGTLFSVTLTSPTVESLFVNRQDIIVPEDEVPPPDGTYSLIVGVIATDRLGNPVPEGTALQFGLLDTPTAGFPSQGSGQFALFGLNGDPQEGGTLFTAPTGAFTTAGGGAGPNDTLVLFGRETTGNRDLEGARIVGALNSATSLTVQRRFNFNDDTGNSVNNGAVIPYAIGRASIGNIVATATTNELGVATTTFNYPVSQLGRTAIIWVQGNGEEVAGEPKTVGDVEFYYFAGLAPAILSAAPSSITANQGASVSVCLTDARNEAFQGAEIGFAFENLTSGSGQADGQAGSGSVGPTGSSGCVNVSVVTTGIQASDGEDGPRLRFFVGGAEAIVQIVGGIEPEPPAEPVTLTINIEGSGMGDVRVNGSAGGFSPIVPSGTVLCAYEDAPCTINLVAGAVVGLTAVIRGTSTFDGWTVDCSGNSGNISLLMNGNKTCTATFNEP